MNSIIREKIWVCSSCSTRQSGRDTACSACGNPREIGERRSAAGGGRAVTDPELLRRALAGPDWDCVQCESGNRAGLTRCLNCGVSRPGQKENTDESEESEAATIVAGPTVRASSASPATSHRPVQIPPPAAFPAVSPFPSFRLGWGTAVFTGAGVISILGLLGVGWLLSTHEVIGEVTRLDWHTSVVVSRWTDTTVDRWAHQTTEIRPRKPVNGRGEQAGLTLVPGSCRPQLYDTLKVPAGTEQKCTDTYEDKSVSVPCQKTRPVVCGETCTDLDNGFESCKPEYCEESYESTCADTVRVPAGQKCETVTVYKDEEVYRDRCVYQTQRWLQDRILELTGEGHKVDWPHFDPTELEKGHNLETYWVSVTYPTPEGQNSLYRQGVSREEYATWQIGDPMILTIRNTGHIADIRRKD